MTDRLNFGARAGAGADPPLEGRKGWPPLPTLFWQPKQMAQDLPEYTNVDLVPYRKTICI